MYTFSCLRNGAEISFVKSLLKIFFQQTKMNFINKEIFGKLFLTLNFDFFILYLNGLC